MTTLVATRSSTGAPASPDPARKRTLRPTLVEVLACGDPGRGDDGASLAALAELADRSSIRRDHPARRRSRHRRPSRSPTRRGAVVVDTATGIDPGWVVEIPFIGFAGRSSGIRARSSDVLSRPETVGVASMIRGRPLVGVLVAIGGASFGPGDALSWPVAAGLCSFRVAIIDAIERVRAQVIANALPHA